MEHDPGYEPRPEQRTRSRWGDFIPQMLANTAGTLLAAVIVYLYAVVAGLIQANWRVLAPILLAVALSLTVLIQTRIEDWLETIVTGSGWRRAIKLEALEMAASAPLVLLFVFTLNVWTKQKMPTFLLFVIILAVLILAYLLPRFVGFIYRHWRRSR